MQINTPKDVMFVPDFHSSVDLTGDELKQFASELEDWLIQLQRSLEEYFKKIYYDLASGTTKLTYSSDTATTSTLDVGQMQLYLSGTSHKLYVNNSGTVVSVTLT